MLKISSPPLLGQKALVLGIANEHSIAVGCARAFRQLGADLAITYLLGPKGIRVHALSPGPIKTRAAGGLKDFDLLLNEAVQRAPVGELVDIDDVGLATAYLATPYARRITGSTVFVDAGLNIMA